VSIRVLTPYFRIYNFRIALQKRPLELLSLKNYFLLYSMHWWKTKKLSIDRRVKLINYLFDITQKAHLKRLFIAPTKWLLLQDRRTMMIDNITSTYDNLEIFEELPVYPDSDVILARRFDDDFLQLMSVYRPSPQRAIIWENRGNWTIKNGLRMSTFDMASTRRRNLQQSVLKSCLVVLWTHTCPLCKEAYLTIISTIILWSKYMIIFYL